MACMLLGWRLVVLLCGMDVLGWRLVVSLCGLYVVRLETSSIVLWPVCCKSR